MNDERKQLPATSVPVEGYKLIRAFARDADLSTSEAVRQLLKESPRLVEFASKEGWDLESLEVNAWGGSRKEAEPG